MNVDVTLEVTSDAARFQLPKSSAHHPPVLVQLPAANRALFPKKHIEKELKDAPGGTSIVLWGEHSTGTSLVAIGYKYNKKSVLYFVSTPGAGTTEDGEPYEMKWADEHGNINVRHVPRPEVISHFFQHSNSVDVHNHLRQYCLKLEKKMGHEQLLDASLHYITQHQHSGHLSAIKVSQLASNWKVFPHRSR